MSNGFLTAFQVTAHIRATFSMSFFVALIDTLNLVLRRRAVAQKKALLLGFLDVRSSFHEAHTGGNYRHHAPIKNNAILHGPLFLFFYANHKIVSAAAGVVRAEYHGYMVDPRL